MKTGKILIVDDNTDILFALRLLLKKHFEIVHTQPNPEMIPALMSKVDYDVILLHMNFTKDASSGKEGFDWLDKILKIDPQSIVIFITAYGDVGGAVKAIKQGALDFITKPWQNEKLLATVSSAVKLKKSKDEVKELKTKQESLTEIINTPQTMPDFIGESEEMKKVFSTIQKVAETDASVLILGENGTGKELVARALHKYSQRKNEIFIGVDLGAVTETLFESEMFGHVKGAFTDAKTDRPGRFEVASGGTIFLDEIGNLPLPIQAKLLRVLELREVTRVGSSKPTKFDVRLICATNMPLQKMIAEGNYREDLLYRINTVEIVIPPLRERNGDIPILCDYFIKIYAKKYRKNLKKVSAAAIKKLQLHPWPGNVRELQHSLERAVIMSDGGMLQPEDFILSGRSSKNNDMELDTFNLDEVEKTIITKVLKKTGGNISIASKELGLTRTSLYRRMEKYGL